MSGVRRLDVSALPPGAFGSRTVTFWGTLGIVVIESTVFALALGAYFYLVSRFPAWPPHGVAAPELRWGTLNTLILLGSLVPNELARRAGEHVDLGRVRIWMVVCLVFALAFNVVRAFEFAHLNVMWDHDAYGSIVWLLLGLHTTHIVTDFLDSGVLTALMFTGPIEEHRFVDVEENAVYLVLRRARLAANLWSALLGAQTAVDTGDVRWLTPLPLWTGILGGPLAWAFDLLASYAVVKWVCRTGNYAILPLITTASLVMVIGAAAISWIALRRTANDVPTDGGQPRQRARFMAMLGLASCGLFTLQILAGAIPHWVLDACQ